MASRSYSLYLYIFLFKLFVFSFVAFSYCTLLNGEEVQLKKFESMMIDESKEANQKETIIPLSTKEKLNLSSVKTHQEPYLVEEKENELIHLDIDMKSSKKDFGTDKTPLDSNSTVPIETSLRSNSSSSDMVGGGQNENQEPLSHQVVSSNPVPQDDNNEDGIHHNFIVQENVDTPKGLIDWCLKAAKENKFLVVTSSDPSSYFPGISELAQQYLRDNCYIVVGKSGDMCEAFKIYIRIAIYGVALCPRLEGEQLIIKWLPIFPGMDFLTTIFEEGASSNVSSSFFCDRFLYRTILDVSNQ